MAMSGAIYVALFFTVALLVVTAYSLLGALPLLILKHDTPLDSRFIRAFFNTYYLVAMVVAAGASVSYVFSARPLFATGAAAIALLAAFLRARLINTMDVLRVQIQASDAGAIRKFRRLHIGALLINFAQLVVVLSSLGTLSP